MIRSGSSLAVQSAGTIIGTPYPDSSPVLSNPNPQKDQMIHESMDRCLAAQAEAIWPQESQLIARYGLHAGARILDAGCGTGQFAM
ncbi:Methyltransferase type 11, partial [mine drainage metagenome]